MSLILESQNVRRAVPQYKHQGATMGPGHVHGTREALFHGHRSQERPAVL